VLLHALAICATVLMVADLKLAPHPDDFKWDVALVETPAQKHMDPTPAESEPAAPSPTPMKSPEKPAPVQKAQPVQTLQQVVHQVRQIRPIERVPTPSAQQPMQQTDPMVTRSAQSIEARHNPVPVVTEASLTENRQVVHEAAVATAEPQQIVHEAINSTTEARQVTETAVSTVEVPRVVQETAVREPSQSVTEQIVKAATPLSSAESSIISNSVVESSQPQTATVIQEQQALKEHTTATNVPVRSLPATKADYTWLAEALWSKIERLKRYPSMARMNRWQGKVVLRAVVRDTGELVDLQVAESSGHAVLDRDAIEVMRRASPITLKHSLGQSQVVLHIPISYTLQ
jgi:periplasmic protein TonB